MSCLGRLVFWWVAFRLRFVDGNIRGIVGTGRMKGCFCRQDNRTAPQFHFVSRYVSYLLRHLHLVVCAGGACSVPLLAIDQISCSS